MKKKIEIIFFSTCRKITVGGFVNQQINKILAIPSFKNSVHPDQLASDKGRPRTIYAGLLGMLF